MFLWPPFTQFFGLIANKIIILRKSIPIIAFDDYVSIIADATSVSTFLKAGA